MKPRILFIIVLCIISLGCSKNKPIEGKYSATLYYDFPTDFTRHEIIGISDPSKNEITINNSVIQKDGKTIKGKIVDFPNTNGILIEGEWSKQFLSNAYTIEGNFVEVYYQNGQEFENTGTFIMEGDF